MLRLGPSAEKSRQYFRLLSPSDVLFITKSGTAPKNACASFNSLRRCEVWCFITGARETVTVTLAVPSYFSLRHVKAKVVRVVKKGLKLQPYPAQTAKGELALPFCSLEIYFSDAGDASCSIDLCVLQVCRYTTPPLRRSCTSISMRGTAFIAFIAEVWSLIAPSNENI